MSLWIPQNVITETDFVLGKFQEDSKIFYIDVVVVDAGTASSFTGGTLLLEWGATHGGKQQDIDPITIANDAELTEVDLDGLTSTDVIPAGSFLFHTGATISGISYGLMVYIWYVPVNED